MKPDRSKMSVGTRTEELLFAMLLVLDDINDKLTESPKALDKVADKTTIAQKMPSINSKPLKK